MRWRELAAPQRMTRVAIVAPQASLRRVLVEVADEGVVQFDAPDRVDPQQPSIAVLPTGPTNARLSRESPDLAECRRNGRDDLLAGEAEVARYADASLARGHAAALAGWTPDLARPALARRLETHGGSVVALARPRGVDPPSLLRRVGLGRSFAPLVETYGTVPYADIDPTLLAGLAYVVMFGMMFADVGHGLLLLALGLLLRRGWPRRAAGISRAWPFLAGAGLASMLFGFLYGECFGPSGLVPVLWLKPLDRPVPLLLVGVATGALLLAGAYIVGTVNRVREGGWALAFYAPSGIAGGVLFVALGAFAAGWYLHLPALVVAGGVLATTGLLLAFAGLLAGAGGGGAGFAQACIELFDLVIRLGSNLVSFARLAAFGLTHAALGGLVWSGTAGLWHRGGVSSVLAVVLFVAGNMLTFALEGLVAGIQALRLEYYELFSRVFQSEGRAFEPWHIPLSVEEVTP